MCLGVILFDPTDKLKCTVGDRSFTAYGTVYRTILGYLKDSNAAAHSVDTGIS